MVKEGAVNRLSLGRAKMKLGSLREKKELRKEKKKNTGQLLTLSCPTNTHGLTENQKDQKSQKSQKVGVLRSLWAEVVNPLS
jgi:hypothetical protein